MRYALALLLFASLASAEENCGSMLRTMTHFRGTVRSADTVAVTTTPFDPVDLDPNFVVVIDATDGRKFALGIHSLANTFGDDPVGHEFAFDAEQMECGGTFRRLLTLQVHHGSRYVEDFGGQLQVGHRYRAKIERTKDGDLALIAPLQLPRHHEGGVSFTNADQFKSATRDLVFDVVSLRITQEAERQWLSLYDATIVDEHAAQCDIWSFSAVPQNTLLQLSQPFVVRQFRGRFLDAEGVFPDDDFVFELHGPDGLSMRLPIASDGSFEAKKLRPGRYCFQMSSPSFQGWTGIVIIDEHAPAENTIELPLKLGI